MLWISLAQLQWSSVVEHWQALWWAMHGVTGVAVHGAVGVADGGTAGSSRVYVECSCFLLSSLWCSWGDFLSANMYHHYIQWQGMSCADNIIWKLQGAIIIWPQTIETDCSAWSGPFSSTAIWIVCFVFVSTIIQAVLYILYIGVGKSKMLWHCGLQVVLV